jgi:hypothetical protein
MKGFQIESSFSFSTPVLASKAVGIGLCRQQHVIIRTTRVRDRRDLSRTRDALLGVDDNQHFELSEKVPQSAAQTVSIKLFETINRCH